MPLLENEDSSLEWLSNENRATVHYSKDASAFSFIVAPALDHTSNFSFSLLISKD